MRDRRESLCLPLNFDMNLKLLLKKRKVKSEKKNCSSKTGEEKHRLSPFRKPSGVEESSRMWTRTAWIPFSVLYLIHQVALGGHLTSGCLSFVTGKTRR